MEFHILGSLEVRSGGKLVRLGGAKQRTLLAMFLLHREAVVSSDRLIGALWPHGPPATVRKALHVHLSQLRHRLTGTSGGEFALETRAPGYILHADADALDSARFELLVERAARQARVGDYRACAGTLGKALALWRGPALADFAYEPFASSEITRLEGMRQMAVESRIDARLAQGDSSQLVTQLEVLVEELPLRERVRAQLMLALYRCGRQAEALASYREGFRALREIGVEPGHELQELERAILVHDPRLASED